MVGTKGAETSLRLAESMLELIQRHGYSGTGLNTVVEHAGAPKGSLYFHFPQGKEALGEKAVELAAARFGSLVADSALGSATPGEVLRRVIDELAGMLDDSGFQLGCPVSVVTLEMGAQSERLRDACANAFESWIAPVSELLIAHGRPRPVARALATAVVSMVEGAVIVSRAQRSTEPLHCAAEALAVLLEQGTEASA
ncbi:TetR/AcrR family transcriptional regulator (plasmid) [Streptomyces sp. NBC_00841]|uniref:TetR/AcrR family transcriptional regulator n=1 Tax=unclassified Streptomyces TaxID=2593676 RepID=UPI002256BDCF|nr:MULTISPECIES: TetR/AcrR family transcriptional regulator [unclassified Streptomyces]MCX4538055.1 TetR/AcrR family transcriptional regulator [Streptomyces sp. NBC_01669]WSA05230.1 TetR/AcrR family transcriptional regulator [Streptomyces sp. NBC_00841]